MRALRIIAGIVVAFILLACLPGASYIAAFLTPISFYGKVVDEQGTPLPGATVKMSFCSTPGGGDPTTQRLTDADGCFSGWGHGLGVGVMVSKDGYYHLKESDGNFSYVQAAGTVDRHFTSKNRAMFVLRKIGKTNPLIVNGVGGSLAKNGTPTEINFQSGQKVPACQGDVRIECWTNDQGIGPNSHDHFDWKCRISANGGLIERKGEFDFDAPTVGYQQSTEIDMPKSLGNQWRSSITKEYFLKLSNGTYARMRFGMNAGGEQTFWLTSYLNPQQDSRNLEYGSQERFHPH